MCIRDRSGTALFRASTTLRPMDVFSFSLKIRLPWLKPVFFPAAARNSTYWSSSIDTICSTASSKQPLSLIHIYQEELVLFRYPKDYHNAKAVLKAEFLGTDPEKYLTEGGSFSPEAMVSMIRERNFVFMSSEMKEAVNRAAEVRCV